MVPDYESVVSDNYSTNVSLDFDDSDFSDTPPPSYAESLILEGTDDVWN